ncbi:MAG: hypothetical protein QOD05_2133 [Microbacteriaceae bacterium]|nr:hypothetical protein [Leifsonia sp.]MDQ1581358.1 hypothetical protein [Microbacteriaceae bacterium]MDQ1587253.1 hypothetical protein [Microbacteriaceae bacterium]HEV7566244.1 hypothetical protein [Microbacteriaceae bacterium]
MSNNQNEEQPGQLPVPGAAYHPSRKDRLRPAELLVLSGVMALFTGLIVLMATREFILAGIALGVAFIVALVVLAMFSLSFKPNADEVSDLEEQNRGK